MILLLDGPKGLRTAPSSEFVWSVGCYLDDAKWRGVRPQGATGSSGFVLYYEHPGGDRCVVYLSFMRWPL